MDMGEQSIGRFAGLGQQDVVGRPVRRERRGCLDHVVEKRNRVLDSGNHGIGLEEGVVKADIKQRF